MNIEKLIKERDIESLNELKLNALHSGKLDVYFLLCNELGTPPDDNDSYELGKSIYQEWLKNKTDAGKVSEKKQRQKPTMQLIVELCGNNQDLISSLHHGLAETPMHAFYPYLDLDELVAFEASSWKSRKKTSDFTDFVRYANLYEIFSRANEIGFPWLGKHKNISGKLSKDYAELNPFSGREFKTRLKIVERIKPYEVERLKKKLQENTKEYVFECQYEEKKRQTGTNYGIEIMHFQNVYPKKGRIIPSYASQIARILSKYPVTYKPIEMFQKEKFK